MTSPTNIDAREKTEQVARASYGKLIAILASRNGDIAAAEDALADAFAKALDHWPQSGIPDNPEAWLITTARNRQIDIGKSAYIKTSAGSLDDETSQLTPKEEVVFDFDQTDIPDKRLQLLFACAHPAIDPSIHTPLMLQTVLGLEANHIASAFLIPSATMAQRLVRAKRKIKTAKVPFSLPQKDDMAPRLGAVLEAIYGAYAVDWHSEPSLDVTSDLSKEALYLASLIVDLMPDEPEALGLAALLAFSISRRTARIDGAELFVPLEEQDPTNWDRLLIRRGQNLLARAAQFKQPGRFQLEAAIQSVHAERSEAGEVDWHSICQLYEGLIAIAPTAGSVVARAAAVGKAFGAEAGLKALSQIDATELSSFQPFWATKAHLLAEKGSKTDALTAYQKAISLATEINIRRWLESKCKAIQDDTSDH